MEELKSNRKRKELAGSAPLEDSAQQDLRPEAQIEVYRNALFDAIFNSGISYYAALLTDQPERNLFCGQIGEIQNVILDKNTKKNSSFLKFIDFDNDQDEITNFVVKKENLLPLFSFDPTRDDQIKTRVKGQIQDEILTIKEIRDIWEEKKFNKISTDTLEPHSKSEARFEIGQLATVQVDFEQKLSNSNNEKFIIQAGQTGIISNVSNTDIDYVEVTFWSMLFDTLALEREQLVTKNQNPGSVAASSDSESLADSFDPERLADSFDPESLADSFNPESLADSPWKKTIHIHKDYVFPLYCEALDYHN
jgi:hypothetical protein